VYRLSPRPQGGGVGLLLIRSEVLGNESSENRNRVLGDLSQVRYSQYLWKHRNITSAKTDPLPDANLLKGSKAIAEKADFGSILLPLTETDQEKLQPYLEHGYPMPNTKLSVYKNRRGSFVRGYLWLDMDKASCRYITLFATDWSYQQVPLKAFDIEQPVI